MFYLTGANITFKRTSALNSSLFSEEYCLLSSVVDVRESKVPKIIDRPPYLFSRAGCR